MDDDGIIPLGSSEARNTLKDLGLEGVNKITDKTIEALKPCSGLKKLWLQFCARLTDTSLLHMAKSDYASDLRHLVCTQTLLLDSLSPLSLLQSLPLSLFASSPLSPSLSSFSLTISVSVAL